MDLSILILWMCQFVMLGVSGDSIHLYCTMHKNSCEQTQLTLIRHCLLQGMNWVCNVCKLSQNRYLIKRVEVVTFGTIIGRPLGHPCILFKNCVKGWVPSVCASSQNSAKPDKNCQKTMERASLELSFKMGKIV